MLRYMIVCFSRMSGPIAPAQISASSLGAFGHARTFLEWKFVVTIEFRVSRLSAPIIVFLLTLASTVATVHAAENPRKITVVSFGLFGDEGVFRREATGAAQIVANRFGADPVVVKYNTKTGGSATVETLATHCKRRQKG